ncbi:hypothetical protein IKF23_03705, partial [Candidatus Saccharibacteria bacterium]|nr:hypothetical protein [Candidatus Saccharibacteria bacterium]
PVPVYMQYMTPAACTTTPRLVTDIRDNQEYYVARLADGKCWMIQNLRLGQNLETTTGSMVLTDEDTDISTNDIYNPRSEFILNNRLAEDDTAPGNPATISAFKCKENHGCYYNWYTAGAGANPNDYDTENPDNMNLDFSTTICPKNWTMPTSGNKADYSSDFKLLVDAYGYGTDTIPVVLSRLLVYPTSATENINGAYSPGLVLNGYYYGNVYAWGGQYGYLWSRTKQSATVAFQMTYSSAESGYYLNPQGAANQSDLKPVRCLLQE